MITHHQYLAKHPISPASEKLIVGTIHPHDHEKFTLPFFYGNQCSLWKILQAAFPTELTNAQSLDSILAFLRRRKIAMSDMIWECKRTTPAALHKDLIPTVLNEELPDQNRHSNIREVFFTSGFDKNAAFQLFYKRVLGQRITPAIRKSKEVTLDSAILGRPIRLRILYSPSGTANTGLVRSAAYIANQHKYSGQSTPVQAFKIDYYREMFAD
jgi:G:T/U-mismatch repair DNA glycosylase